MENEKTVQKRLRIAVPSKGRLLGSSIAMLRQAGIDVPPSNGSLFASSKDGRYEIIYARAEDVPRYVESGAADCGITGIDMVEETGADVAVLCGLGFGACRVSVAGRQGTTLAMLEGKTIATRLPNTAGRFFASRNIPVKIMQVSGAAELTPYLGIADAIVDQVSSGSTLSLNNLVEIEKVLDSRAVLVAGRNNATRCEALRLSVQGVMEADGKAYLMLNVANANVEKVSSLLGGLESPTMMPLAEKGMFALHSVVGRNGLEVLIEKLKANGAKDILVLGIERIIP